jgi:hypothetical protein
LTKRHERAPPIAATVETKAAGERLGGGTVATFDRTRNGRFAQRICLGKSPTPAHQLRRGKCANALGSDGSELRYRKHRAPPEPRCIERACEAKELPSQRAFFIVLRLVGHLFCKFEIVHGSKWIELRQSRTPCINGERLRHRNANHQHIRRRRS